MAGVQAGRLNIEIVAEIARLQQDLDKAKRAVKSMSNDIARDTKAANDNFSRMGQNFERTGQRVAASAGAQRAGMQQLTMQIGDMATMYSLGARPMQIFASQSAQVVGAIQLMSGGASKFAVFMGGPWGAALTAGTLILAPFVAKLFEAEDAAQKVEFASYKLSDAQGILGSVMDLITGKINTQSQALMALAQAQLVAGQIAARREQAAARSQMIDIRKGSISLQSGMMGGLRVTRTGDATADVVSAYQEGGLSLKEAERGLRSLLETGLVTEESYIRAAEAVTRFGVAAENLKVFEDAQAALGGDRGALQQFLDPKKGGGRKPGLSDAEKALKQRNAESERFIENLKEEIAKIGLDEKAIRQLEVARAMENAVTAQQRADIALLNAEREKAIAQQERELRLIEAKKEGDKLEQRVEATRREAQVIELAGWAREKALLRMEREAEIAPLLIRQKDALARGEAKLADELARQVALLDEQYGLQIQSGDRVDQLAQWEERYGTLRDFLAEVNKTPAEMQRAFEGIKMRGLDALNDGLVDAIVNFKSLGDVAESVVKQILAELLRLQIQKAIIAPLANALGLTVPGGGPTNLLSGTPYGGRAAGGAVSAGRSYLVGEHGPEVLTMGAQGYITPNDRGRSAQAGSQPVVVEIVAGEMFDARVVQGAAQVYRAAAPGMLDTASAKTRRDAARPITPGGRTG